MGGFDKPDRRTLAEKVAAWTAEDFPLQRCVCKCHFQPALLVLCIFIFWYLLRSILALCLVCVLQSVIMCGLFPCGKGFLLGCSLECQLFFWKFKTPSHVFAATNDAAPFRLCPSKMQNLLSAKLSKLPASSASCLQRVH